MQLNKDFYLGAKHIRNNGHRHVIHGAELVTSQAVVIVQMNRRHKNNRRFLKARMFADGVGQLKTIHSRHADVGKNHRDIVLQELLQSFFAGAGLDKVLSQLAQHRFIREQLRRLIIHQEDVNPIGHSTHSSPNSLRLSQVYRWSKSEATAPAFAQLGTQVPITAPTPRLFLWRDRLRQCEGAGQKGKFVELWVKVLFLTSVKMSHCWKPITKPLPTDVKKPSGFTPDL